MNVIVLVIILYSIKEVRCIDKGKTRHQHIAWGEADAGRGKCGWELYEFTLYLQEVLGLTPSLMVYTGRRSRRRPHIFNTDSIRELLNCKVS
jgi:hypothetical protein